MNRETIESRDGTPLSLVRWDAPSESKGQVLIVHGLAEHMGRYEHVAAALVAAGFSVAGIELRGHGDSEGQRGHVDNWQQYVEDLFSAVEALGGQPYLVGHSMGGLVALDAIRTGLEVSGVSLSNPLVGVSVEAPAIKIAAAKVLSRILPKLSLDNELDVTQISRDADVVARYEADPKVYRKISSRWYTEMLAAMDRVHAAAPEGAIPLLLQQGDADSITSPDDARTFYGAWGHVEKQRTVYPDLYHEIFNEPEKEKVLSDLATWLVSRA
jgi:alpha-beta hydrolase superfamily lysophospholipase